MAQASEITVSNMDNIVTPKVEVPVVEAPKAEIVVESVEADQVDFWANAWANRGA